MQKLSHETLAGPVVFETEYTSALCRHTSENSIVKHSSSTEVIKVAKL